MSLMPWHGIGVGQYIWVHTLDVPQAWHMVWPPEIAPSPRLLVLEPIFAHTAMKLASLQHVKGTSWLPYAFFVASDGSGLQTARRLWIYAHPSRGALDIASKQGMLSGHASLGIY